MAEKRPDYLSYLLRMWRAQEEGREVWRASLQHVETGERASFRSLEELFAYLRQQTGVVPDEEQGPEEAAG